MKSRAADDSCAIPDESQMSMVPEVWEIFKPI